MSQSKTALVVDDEQQLLRLIGRVFERAGYRVLTAANAAEARRCFAEERGTLSVALLDVVMPEGDGAAELLPEFLREQPDLKMILTSGDALPDALADELGRCGGRFLRKPFVPRTLLRMIEPTPDGPPATPPQPGLAGPGSV